MQRIKITTSITVKEPMLDKYFREIDKLPLLSPDEEAELSILIQKGDKSAIDKLTKANLRFVISIAKKYQGQGLPLQDLINEGNLGLIAAAYKFDASRGFKFISYAVWYIRQQILLALADHSKVVRLPIKKVILNGKIFRSYCRLEQELERAPSANEIAEVTNMEVYEVEKCLSLSTQNVSLDSPIGDDEESGTFLDILVNNDENKTETELYHKQSLKTEVKRLLQELTDKQREVLCWFFGIGIEDPLSLDDIARKMYLTTERVRQIKDKAIEKLRTNESINLLRGFLAA